MNYLAAPLLLLMISVGYASVVLGLALLVHVVGVGAAAIVLLVLFAGCMAISGRML